MTAHGADWREVASDNPYNPLAKKLLDTVGRVFKPPLRVVHKLDGLALAILRKGADGVRRILLLFFKYAMTLSEAPMDSTTPKQYSCNVGQTDEPER